MKSIRFFYFVFILLVCLFSSNVVRAHGFGQRYDLPVPLSLWVLGAGITIVLSFILIAMFATTTFEQFHYSRINLLKSGFFRMLIKPFVLFLIRLIGVIILVTAIIAGYWGDTNPYNNVTPVLVWVIWWVGVVYVSVLVGDLDGGTSCIDGIPLGGAAGITPDADFLAQVTASDNCFSFIETIPTGFVPRFGGDNEDSSFTIGVRGELDYGTGLSYDVSAQRGSNRSDFMISNTINASLGPDTPRDFVPGGQEQT